MALFKMRGFPKFDFKSEKPENKTNYNKARDYNTDKYDQSAGQTVASNKFKFTQEDRPNPTYEGTDEYRGEKNISTKEKSKRGVAKKSSNLKNMGNSAAASLTLMGNSAAGKKYSSSKK
jgi:hypothetical protein|tara:strand:+ start:2628 stop:2984 length:357 start_codon:yes stop_codon:yes gene_type:complete